MLESSLAIHGSYDARLVVLSVAIAVLASHAALDLGGRVTSAKGAARRWWLGGGASAMGLGIWAMHYVGMLAFQLPVTILYDWPTVLLSLLAAVAASAVALYVVSRATMKVGAAAIGSACMGGAIAGMHYIGMAAMRLPGACHYSAAIVGVSIFLAVVISLVALVLAFRFRREERAMSWQKALSAVVMGSAIAGMHYTGMAAASFVPATMMEGTAHALNISFLGMAGISGVTIVILGMAIVTSLVDRRFSAQAQELEASERRSKQILETSFDPFIAMNREGRIGDWSAQAEVVFGKRRQDVLERIFSETILPERWRDNFATEITRLLRQEQGEAQGRRFELIAMREDGGEFPAEVTISAIGKEKDAHFAAFVRDLSERKRGEEELRKAKEAAESANQAKSTFLATMSHEIRTPMNGILGMTELVLDSELTREQRENLELVRFSAEALLTVINDVLDFSKIEAGKLELESIGFNLREGLGETMKALGVRAHEKGLELVYEVGAEVPEGVEGDPGRIRQVLINLVGNAIKFTEKGEVHVSVEEDESESGFTILHFRIRDTGIGVASEHQGKIFEAFSQADGSMARKYGGTGLGLTICSRLVAMMGGRIWLESELGKGTTFHFTARLKQRTQITQTPQHWNEQRLRGLDVLVVDDNVTNQRVLKGMLEGWGMNPTAVDGARPALTVMEAAKNSGRPFALILVDGQMPEIDGFMLAGMIRDNPAIAGPTIMMLTSAGNLGDAARCREFGIAAHLVKPIRQAELLDAIRTALRFEAEAEPERVTRHVLEEAKNRLRILLAEDNAVNQRLAVRLLEKRGYTVAVAANGREAIEAMKKDCFDTILMDIQMPEMDGFEATRAIRELEKSTGRRVAIIAMTAHALKGDEDRCLSAGMDGYVSKPIRSAELFETIERVRGEQRK